MAYTRRAIDHTIDRGRSVQPDRSNSHPCCTHTVYAKRGPANFNRPPHHMHVHLWRGSAPPLANLKATNLRATVYYFGLNSCLEPALKFSSLRSMADGRCVSASPNAARRTNKAAHMQTNEPMRCVTWKICRHLPSRRPPEDGGCPAGLSAFAAGEL